MSKILKSSWGYRQKRSTRVINIKEVSTTVFNGVTATDPDLDSGQMILEARQEADKIMEIAENEAKKLKEKIEQEKVSWKQEKESLMKQAYQEGYERGIEQGRQDGYKEYKTLLQSAKNVVEQSKMEAEKNMIQSEKVILDLAVKTAEKILGTVLEKDEHLFLSLVKRSMKEIKDSREVELHIHPSRYELLLSQKEELEAIFPSAVQLYLYPDEDLDLNDCIIETIHGRLDASVDSQLFKIRQALMEMFEGDLA
ncbi:MAG: flagellar assembly protein FliH [Bacillales bacterium]|nr:flagellar assembly protein FliH [Bacillales bacterium]